VAGTLKLPDINEGAACIINNSRSSTISGLIFIKDSFKTHSKVCGFVTVTDVNP